MKKMTALVVSLMLLVSMCVSASAWEWEVEQVTADPAMYDKPEERNITIEDINARKFLDLPYCGENSTKTQKLHLFLPNEGEGPFPVIVSVHGGSWLNNNSTKFGTMTFTQAAALKLLDYGYAVACIDYSLKTKKNPCGFPLMMQEVRAAVRYVRSVAGEYNLDADHIALIGESAGGQLVDMAGTTGGEAYYELAELGNMEYSGDVQAVIAQYSAPIMRADKMTANIYGTTVDELTEEMLDAVSAIKHVDANDPPFFIEHGSADTTINYKDSVAFYEALVAAGVQNCELHIYEGFDHAVSWFQSDEMAKLHAEWLNKIFGR